MSMMDTSSETEARSPGTETVELKLEVVVLPVSDAERAKRFYASLGWREDADFAVGGSYRVLQFTPPGSQASVIFGTGVTAAAPGSLDRLVLAVRDLRAAREQLRAQGVDVSDVFHDAGGGLAGGFHAGADGRAPGPDPEGRSYGSYASFSDPDGNVWVLQEITERLPGRVDRTDLARLAELLHETAEHHDPYEKAAPPHDWWDWYAPFLSARQHGSSLEQATAAADRYMEEVRGVTVER